mmetsp:Transcript_11119/g.18162  ORF Transcript_11119/g.18162 Transcript_11119/m.18162 type:complete len:435 (-) Transcript_11119:167-1471(-)
MRQRTWILLAIALLSRLLVFVCGFVATTFVQEYDTSASLVFPEARRTIFGRTLSLFAKWDSFFFVRISEHGYEYEQTFAFFPLFPGAISSLSSFLSYLGRLRPCATLLSGVIISLVSFLISVVLLYRLTYRLTDNELLAYRSSCLFCFNPAGIFMSAIYTESPYAALSFGGVLCLIRKSPYCAAILFMCAGAVRSNGILYGSFLVWYAFAECVSMKKDARIWRIGMCCVHSSVQVTMVALPTCLFQYYAYVRFCQGGNSRPWCESYLPMIYSFVQKHYWNVGFLRFYRIEQLPNFCLALPMLAICALGLPRLQKSKAVAILPHPLSFGSFLSWCSSASPQKQLVVLLTGHYLLLVFIASTTMHIQVITRFVSACPALYWFAATLAYQDKPPLPSQQKGHSKRTPILSGHSLIWGYFLSYTVFGALLFCSFYPWT